MTTKATYLLGILAAIILGTLLYINLCSECGLTKTVVETVQEEVIPPIETIPQHSFSPFAFEYGDFAHKVNDNFNFNVSNPSFLMPISEELKGGVSSLKDYLDSNPDRSINIIGHYTSDEENISAFPNLGLARANSVKNHFVVSGISSKRINTEGKLMEDLIPKENVFLGPVSYVISEADVDAEEKLKALYEEIKSDPLVLYFQTGEAAINLTATQRQKVAMISKYLDKADDGLCLVVGHTDNTGSRETNIALGQERADFAKAYLVRNAIPASKIQTSSQGPDSPIASNDTEEGRAKNRRTVVTLN
ncbi:MULTISPECIES: OmpA family protein [Flavobacteriaceae]|uniref:OmpA family protein n=1 Tax=Flavobacteriaceae TaxID=49546 RepID=UPI001492D611|nr:MULTISPECIES: OmpA family protein [Allomuricauda]MDC6365297.1 OmpA family protein [Muricauda sp. AC10]